MRETWCQGKRKTPRSLKSAVERFCLDARPTKGPNQDLRGRPLRSARETATGRLRKFEGGIRSAISGPHPARRSSRPNLQLMPLTEVGNDESRLTEPGATHSVPSTR